MSEPGNICVSVDSALGSNHSLLSLAETALPGNELGRVPLQCYNFKAPPSNFTIPPAEAMNAAPNVKAPPVPKTASGRWALQQGDRALRQLATGVASVPPPTAATPVAKVPAVAVSIPSASNGPHAPAMLMAAYGNQASPVLTVERRKTLMKHCGVKVKYFKTDLVVWPEDVSWVEVRSLLDSSPDFHDITEAAFRSYAMMAR